MRVSLRSAHLSLALLALAACGGAEKPVEIKLVTKNCAGASTAAPFLRFSLYGDGINATAMSKVLSLASAETEMPNITPGKNRRILIEALTSATSGEVLSRGATGLLDAELTEPDTLEIPVVLRPLDAFAPVQDAAGACGAQTALGKARAGHTATTLEDGRVLIAGGFVVDAAGQGYLKTTEIFDPRTGQFAKGPDLGLQRAFHTATHIPGTTYTLLAGGENSPNSPDNPNTSGSALKNAELFNEGTNTFTTLTMKFARTSHAAAVPVGGSGVLIVGGKSTGGTPLKSTEVFDLQTKSFTAGPDLDHPRGDLAAVGLPGGQVLVVGGFDGTTAVSATELLTQRPASTTFDVSSDWKVELKASNGSPDGRLRPNVELLGEGRVIVTGGYTQRAAVPQTYASQTTQVIDTVNRVATAGPSLLQKRVFASSVRLADGSVLVLGGSYIEGSAKARDTAEHFVISGDGKISVSNVAVKLAGARHLSAATLLQDGTVLVAGGVTYESATPVPLTTAEIYQPPYQAGATSPFTP